MLLPSFICLFAAISAAPNIRAFLDKQGFPRGVLLTKQISGNNKDPLLDQERYKIERIEALLTSATVGLRLRSSATMASAIRKSIAPLRKDIRNAWRPSTSGACIRTRCAKISANAIWPGHFSIDPKESALIRAERLVATLEGILSSVPHRHAHQPTVENRQMVASGQGHAP